MLAISLVIRLALLIGPTGADDPDYMRFAERLLHWEHFNVLHHHGGRLVFLVVVGLPAAISGSVYGGALASLLLLSLRDVGVVLYLRRRVNFAGLLSGAAILTLNPITMIYAGIMRPDGLLSLLMTAAAVLAFECVNTAGARRAWMIAACGFLSWAAYSVKETGILIVPCVALWLVMPRSRRTGWLGFALRDLAIFSAVFAAGALLEMAVYKSISGDALYRFSAVAETHNTHGDVTEVHSVIQYAKVIYWNLTGAAAAAALPLLALAAIIFPAALWKRVPLAFFAWCGSFITLYLIAGSSSLTRAIPLPLLGRYFEVVIPFLAIAAASLVGVFQGDARPMRAPSAPIIALALSLGIMSLVAVVRYSGEVAFSALGRNTTMAIKAISTADPARPIYASPEVLKRIYVFLPRATFNTLRPIPLTGPLPRGFYLINQAMETESNYPRVREVLAMPTYLTLNETHNIFGRFPTLPASECVVRYLN